jgi:putative ABC transport system substrate-binding protein
VEREFGDHMLKSQLLSRHTRRREFIALISRAGFAWSAVARAQPADRMRRIAVFSPVVPDDFSSELRHALQEMGWVEGRTFAIDFFGGASSDAEVTVLVRKLVSRSPDVILAIGVPGLAPIVRETRTIPVVFVSVSDPVGQGFVASLARPGGNITGFTNFENAIGGKWVELLKAIAPDIANIAIMYNPATAPYVEAFLPSTRSSAAALALTLVASPVRTDAEIESIVIRLAQGPRTGLIVPPDAFTYRARGLIINLAAVHQLPSIYAFRSFPVAGGLMSYGVNPSDQLRQAACTLIASLKAQRRRTCLCNNRRSLI